MANPVTRTPPRMLDVIDVRDLSPRVRRLVLGGPQLVGLRPCWPAAHIKLFFPRGQRTEPTLPTLGEDGRPVWPPLPERPVTRTYSVRRHDYERGRLEVDFVLHQPTGPASAWAEKAVVGSRVGFAGPGGPEPHLPLADWYLLAGDLSALPAIGALLEAMPRSATGMAFLQVPDAAEIQPLTTPPGVQLTWLVEDAHGRDLVTAVREADWSEGSPFVWLAGEGGQVVAIRDYARAERNVPARELYAVPYWKRRQTEEEYHQERHRVMDELEEMRQ